MATRTNALDALPVAVHGAAQSRQSPLELARFESVLDAADAAVAASLYARRAASVAVVERGEGESADASLNAVLAAIGAITNVPTVPTSMDSKLELVRWTLTTIKDWRDLSVRAGVNRVASAGMDPEHVDACMVLVRALNATLEAGGA